jgi:hypothetical protein
MNTPDGKTSLLFLILFNAGEAEDEKIQKKAIADLAKGGWYADRVIFDNDGMPMICYENEDFCPYNWMMNNEIEIVKAMNEYTGWDMKPDVFGGFPDWQYLKK